MNGKDGLSPPDGDEVVGYGRPPRRTRFQPGRSGNPKGRPKGIRSIARMLQDALLRRVRVQEDGRPKVLTVQEVIVRRLVNDAAKSDPKALKTLLSLIDRYAETTEAAVDMKALAAEDQSILAGYFDEAKGPGAPAEGDSSEGINNPNPGAHDGRSG